MERGRADAKHHFASSDDRSKHVGPAAVQFLTKRERNRYQRGARVHAGARLAQAVELEGMRRYAVGQRGQRRTEARRRAAEHATAPARAIVLGIASCRLRPWEGRTEQSDPDQVDETLRRPFHVE